MAMKKLGKLIYLGPAVIVSVAYIDPGNFGSNIAAGSNYGLKLLWVVWISGLMAILFQYISGKLGLINITIPEYVFNYFRGRRYSRVFSFLYFLGLFIAVLATDMAEFLGIALGLHLLLGIPLFTAIWVSMIDIFILLLFADESTKLEKIIGTLVAIVGLSYVFELYIVRIDPMEILTNSFRINLSSGGEALIATSIIGATVMPHAVLLHSYLTRDKWLGSRNLKDVLKRHAKETLIYLSVASLINAALQVMSYYAFYRNGVFNIDSMEVAYKTLIPFYGESASIIFGIAILASGISSSLVSVLSGVYLIESYVGRHLPEWIVRLFARIINIIPLAIAIYLGLKTIDILVYSQAVLSMTLPLILIPLILISGKPGIMGSLVNRRLTTFIASISTMMIILINLSLPFLG